MAFYLSGTITVPGDAIGRVREALPEHIRLTNEEPGCLSFGVEDRGDGIFAVDEIFKDAEAFKAHQQRIENTKWASASLSAERNYRTWEE